MRLTNRSYLPVLFVAILLIIPLWVVTRHLSFRLDTDYNVILPMATFALRAYTHPFPYLSWNPNIGLGIPALGDSSFMLSPFYMPLFFLFGPDNGLRVLIAVTIIGSGLSMWYFLSSFKLRPWAIAWGAILYEFSGALAAMIAAGHVEKFAGYAIGPVVFLYFFRKRMKPVEAATVGIIYACILLTADFYSLWFFSLFYVVSAAYRIITKNSKLKEIIQEILYIYGFFVAFALSKLLPFIRDVIPHINRLQTIDPYAGSIHAWLLPLSFLIPWQVEFYDRPTLQRIIGFHYNWYEYYAFITPFAVIPLLYIQKVWKSYPVRLAVIFVITAACYISLRYPYSPFYWLFHNITLVRMFRVPQRVVVPLMIPVVMVITFCADYMIVKGSNVVKRYLVLCLIGSVVWLFVMNFNTIKGTFEPFRSNESAIAHELRRRDGSNFFVANFVCCMQPFLLRESIPILNYYYGWTPTYTPRFADPITGKNNFRELTVMRPSYIIADKNESFTQYGYELYFGGGNVEVWRTDTPTIIPSL
ncbi:MAG TPA: hypothetical protein VMR81_04435 [Patescibacteria group bacterium]|nr:hypothetical protein [Patescibacteria group bacterium]